MPKVVKHVAGILLPLGVLAIAKLGIELSWGVLFYVYVGLGIGWALEALFGRFGAERLALQRNEQLTRQIQELDEQRQAADVELATARSQQASLEQQLRSQREENAELAVRLEDSTLVDAQRLQSKTQQQSRELGKQTEQIDTLKGELQTLRRSMDKLRSRAAGSDRRVAQLQRQNTETSKALAQAEQRISLAQNAAEKQLEQTQQVTAQRDKLERQLDDLRRRSQPTQSSAASRRGSTPSAGQDLQTQLATLQSEHTKLSVAYQTLQDAHAALERDAVAAAEADEQQIARLTARIEELSALEDLRS